MKKVSKIIMISALIVTMGVINIACSSAAPTGTPIVTPTPTVTPISQTTPTPTATPAQTDKMKIAADFITNSSTFKFDGIEGSLQFIKAEEFTPISSFRAMEFVFEFQTAHPGHGDRTGQILAQVITTHKADIYLDIDQNAVKIATCDGVWDMVKDQALPPTSTIVSGVVISGGDTATPGGPLDVPHKFIYQIKKADGTLVNVSYTAYPPSPVGDAYNAKITLDFNGGSVNIGDNMEAQGVYDPATNTIAVANEGDYIKTSAP